MKKHNKNGRDGFGAELSDGRTFGLTCVPNERQFKAAVLAPTGDDWTTIELSNVTVHRTYLLVVSRQCCLP